jgi:hypothetical protein
MNTSHLDSELDTVLIRPSLQSCVTDALEVKRFRTKSRVTKLDEEIFPEKNLPNYFFPAQGR